MFVSDVHGFTMKMIQQYDNEGKLTWHGGLPEDELWLKVGGDFGQETFKFCAQLINFAKPNSSDNTVIMNVSEAPDTHYNTQITIAPSVDKGSIVIWSNIAIR